MSLPPIPRYAPLFGLDDDAGASATWLVPVPWEATTSYGRGTARGPETIARESAQVDLFDPRFGAPTDAGVWLRPVDPDLWAWAHEAATAAAPVIAAGEEPPAELAPACERVNALSARATARVRALVDEGLDAGRLVGVVGGDHSVALGAIDAHAARFPGLGVLQFDAHADLRVAYQGFTDSHASVMHRALACAPGVAKIVSVGVRDFCREEADAIAASGGRVEAFFDHAIAARLLAGQPFSAVADAIVAALPQEVYVSFDIDGLDPTLCPHTGTPVPGGLSFHQAIHVLEAVARSGRRIVGFDLCEVAPGPPGHTWDGNVGARVLFQLIGFSRLSRRETAA